MKSTLDCFGGHGPDGGGVPLLVALLHGAVSDPENDNLPTPAHSCDYAGTAWTTCQPTALCSGATTLRRWPVPPPSSDRPWPVFWGWLPALLWIVFGTIFIGAVHDFGTLAISARNGGQGIAELSGDLISPRVRLLFQLIIYFLDLDRAGGLRGLPLAFCSTPTRPRSSRLTHRFWRHGHRGAITKKIPPLMPTLDRTDHLFTC
ncbi:MAG: carbon starvation CstA family protein [Vampirovibrionales bacterium]